MKNIEISNQTTPNHQIIRARLKENGLVFWQLADAAGCAESTVIRHLRKPMPEETFDRYMAAIDTLTAKA